MKFETKSMLRMALLAGSALALVGPNAAIAQDAQPEASAQDTGLSEIVVTAQRREEKSQDVPIAITAISPEGLRERNVTSLQSLQNQVPSLVVAPNGQASRDVMSPTIRGQGTTFQGSPGVVVYMNEVPLPTAITLSGQGGPGTFVDLQSVQVLSGAQGTLFGRNTTGGAILLTAARPTDRLEGHISGGFGNYNMTDLEAVVNVPVTDTLRVRLVGAARDRDGYTQDVQWNKDRDNQHWRTARLGVEFEPVDGIKNYTMAYYGYSKTNGTGSVAVDINTPLLGSYSPLYDLAKLNKLVADQKDRGIRSVAHGLDGFAKVESWSVSNTTDVRLTDGLNLRNIISFASLKSFYANDQDGTTAFLYDAGLNGYSNRVPRDHYELFTEELQLQGDVLDNKLTYTVGGFYSKQKPGGVMQSYAVNACPVAGEVCASFSENAVTNESKALFAQATLDLGALAPALDGVRLTGGYRYTWDTINGSTVNYAPAVPTAGVTPLTDYVKCSFNGTVALRSNAGTPFNAATNPGCQFSGHLKSSAPNWTVGLDYRPIDALMLYAKVTRGYKAGGFNSFAVFTDYATFGPEFVTDWEAGFKSDFKIAGRSVRLNVNGFNMDYDKIQRGLPDYNAATGRTGAVTLNTPKAKIRGFEVEARIKPAAALEIGGNYSYIDAYYKSFTYNSARAVPDCGSNFGNSYRRTKTPDLSCLPLQYLAPNIFSVFGRLSLPTPESVGDVSLFVNYSWTDKQETAPGSLLEYPRPNATDPVKTWEPGVRLPSYGLLNASLDWKKALGTGLDVSLFATNLLNEEYVISNTGVFNSAGAQTFIYGEPRMYGLRLRYNFGN